MLGRLSRILLSLSAISVPPWCSFPSLASEPLPRFDRIVIDADFPSGYQVEVADVNGDGKPDIVGVGGSTCAWYENPSWKKRIISTGAQTPGIISSATIDLDGDGKAEVAIAYEFEMNEPRKGKLLLAHPGKSLDDPWRIRRLADVPSIHRLRWGDVLGDRRPELIVASLFGPDAKPPGFLGEGDTSGRVYYVLPMTPSIGGDWVIKPIGGEGSGSFPILHAIDVLDVVGKGKSEILVASFAGISILDHAETLRDGWTTGSLSPGLRRSSAGQGASEVHLGRLADGRRFLATIEPWHGPEVVVCLAKAPGTFDLGPRDVIDGTLDDGHALWVADVDGDGDDEVFAGHRGKDFRVSAYDYDGRTWNRTVIDRGVAAQDLRGGDLDGDGTPDVVAIGGKTHNVVWYRPIVAKAAKK